MTYDNLQLACADGVATLTIHRPQQFNALNLQSMKELFDAANRLSEDETVRAVVLTGSGDKAFCAGGDIAAFAERPGETALLLKEMTAYLHLAITRLVHMRAPVIAAVNGVAAGAGLGLVAAADLAVASDRARFTSAYTQIGLTPDGGAQYFLPRIVGQRRAAELLLTNRTLSADEALEWGLVNRVIPHAEHMSEVAKLAAQLASGPNSAFGGVKKLLQETHGNGLASHMDREALLIAEASSTHEGREGIAAFAERRNPRFTRA